VASAIDASPSEFRGVIRTEDGLGFGAGFAECSSRLLRLVDMADSSGAEDAIRDVISQIIDKRPPYSRIGSLFVPL
jgi:hypothetical protein